MNEYGVPLHACHGHRHDEHYWTWVKWVTENCICLGSNGVKVFYERPVQ